MEQEQRTDPFSAEMEARVCEIVLGDRRHGLVHDNSSNADSGFALGYDHV